MADGWTTIESEPAVFHQLIREIGCDVVQARLSNSMMIKARTAGLLFFDTELSRWRKSGALMKLLYVHWSKFLCSKLFFHLEIMHAKNTIGKRFSIPMQFHTFKHYMNNVMHRCISGQSMALFSSSNGHQKQILVPA